MGHSLGLSVGVIQSDEKLALDHFERRFRDAWSRVAYFVLDDFDQLDGLCDLEPCVVEIVPRVVEVVFQIFHYPLPHFCIELLGFHRTASCLGFHLRSPFGWLVGTPGSPPSPGG